MSKFLIYVKLQPFVAQWLTNTFGSPVKFDSQSVENSVILQFTKRVPQGKKPDTGSDGDTPIYIPDSKMKDPAVFNYLTASGKKAIEESIEHIFKMNMWAELSNIESYHVKISTAVCDWCEAHGIDVEYADTIRQRYYRLRDAKMKRGVDLRRHTRIKEDGVKGF